MWAWAILGCFLGLVFRPSAGSQPGLAVQALDLVRVLATSALAVVLVLGPGLILRVGNPRRHLDLGFTPLLGLAMLAVTGVVAWALAPEIAPRLVCAAVLAPVLGWLLARVLRAGPEDITTPEERRALLVIAIALGVAVARSLWSLGPPGELLGGTTFRTLEVGERADSAIPFRVVQLVANGNSPFGAVAHSYFGGFTFSDRGPLAGLASTPVVLLTGGRPPVADFGGPWSPFDSQGFMSYRLAMMIFASTAFISLWTLTRRIGGARAARLALLLVATTPFLVHEIWFTWPKLLAASLVLLSAGSLLGRRPFVAGLLLGAGYLAHPLALFSLPTLVLLALWPSNACDPLPFGGAGPRLRDSALYLCKLLRPRLGPTLLLLSGLALCLIAWRVANGSHYTQTSFLHYLTASGSRNLFVADVVRARGGYPAAPALSAWLWDRLVSVGNTLLPLRVLLFSAQDLNATCGLGCKINTPFVVHFFLQYWVALPFALGIAFLPLWPRSLWRAIRTWPWTITAVVLVPFLAFAIYWGGASTGLLREGLHPWLLTLLAVFAIQQGHERFAWLSDRRVRGLLALRALEVLLLALLPTVLTRHRLWAPQFRLTDIVAIVGMVALCGYLGVLVWREPSIPNSVDRAPRKPDLDGIPSEV